MLQRIFSIQFIKIGLTHWDFEIEIFYKCIWIVIEDTIRD